MDDLERQLDGGAVWVTLAELARRKGISRQAAAKRVGRLEGEGRIRTRLNGRNREVDLASFDRAVGASGDAYKEQAAATVRETRTGSQPGETPTLRDAQADKARYDAQLKALDLAERRGQLIPIHGEHGLEKALVKVSERLLMDLGAPLNWISEIMEAAPQGEGAVRRLLRKKVREQRRAVANHLGDLATIAEASASEGFQIDLSIPDDE